jgi:uncharacterized protein (DUF1778 family)
MNNQNSNNIEPTKVETLILDEEATKRFNELMENPPEPNDYLKAAYKDYQNSKLNYGQ